MANKRKYDETTEMMAVRVPVSMHDELKRRAQIAQQPKSDTVVEVLARGLGATETPAPAESLFE